MTDRIRNLCLRRRRGFELLNENTKDCRRNSASRLKAIDDSPSTTTGSGFSSKLPDMIGVPNGSCSMAVTKSPFWVTGRGLTESVW